MGHVEELQSEDPRCNFPRKFPSSLRVPLCLLRPSGLKACPAPPLSSLLLQRRIHELVAAAEEDCSAGRPPEATTGEAEEAEEPSALVEALQHVIALVGAAGQCVGCTIRCLGSMLVWGGGWGQPGLGAPCDCVFSLKHFPAAHLDYMPCPALPCPALPCPAPPCPAAACVPNAGILPQASESLRKGAAAAPFLLWPTHPLLQRKVLVAQSLAKPSPDKVMRLIATSSEAPPDTWQRVAVSEVWVMACRGWGVCTG